MIEDNPDYDVVFYPKFKTTATCPILGLCFILTREKVLATARMGRIKYGLGNRAVSTIQERSDNIQPEEKVSEASLVVDESVKNEQSSELKDGDVVWFVDRTEIRRGTIESIRGDRVKIQFVVEGDSKSQIVNLSKVARTKSDLTLD